MRHAILDSGVEIVTSGLKFWVDAAQLRSYSGSGTTWTDLSGNNNDVTLTGTTFNTSNGGVIDFNGTSTDYGTVGNLSGLNSSYITLESWIKCDNPTGGTNLWILARGNGGTDSATIQKNSFNNFASRVVDTGGTATGIAFNATPTSNWTHIASTWDGTNFVFYINGTQDKTTSLSGSLRTTTPLSVKIGTNTVQTVFWDGFIAISRIYDRGLSGTEIAQNYNAERSRFGL